MFLKKILRRSYSTSASAAAPAYPIVYSQSKVPIYIYSKIDQEELMDQLIGLANSGIAEHYISVMPDVHLGKGATVGTVFASSNYVCPNAVGVDIGCGMCAVPVDTLQASQLSGEIKDAIFNQVKREIPVGFEMHSKPLKSAKGLLEKMTEEQRPTDWLVENIDKKTNCQLGTLGGGNHFIEVLADETDRVWLMLHSGSRFIGKFTADYYNRLAMKQMFSSKLEASKPKLEDLNSMTIDSEEGQNYLQDMQWCQSYAYSNRLSMMKQLIDIVTKITKHEVDNKKIINVHHNYCTCETCQVKDTVSGKMISKNLWITRKGATSAKEGEYGIIPGSMGVGSYIVQGRGNNLSWQSCSHGAGRKLSRKKAKDLISQSDFVSSMKGIVCDTDVQLRDEAPQAYKDLNEVMQNQESLVEIRHRLRPLINVKGFK